MGLVLLGLFALPSLKFDQSATSPSALTFAGDVMVPFCST
jgi:hypothetical protein